MKKFLVFIIIGIVLLTSCTHQKQQQDNRVAPVKEIQSIPDIETQKERFFQLGVESKELFNMSGINDPAILVNEWVITKKGVENTKLRVKLFDSLSLKEEIIKLIRKNIELSEANKLKIEPNQKELSKYLEQTKNAFDDSINSIAFETLQAYMEGLEITKEEYFELLYEQEYENYQRKAWWETIRPEEKIIAEAKERNVDFSDVDYEYHERYVDELMNCQCQSKNVGKRRRNFACF